MIVKLVTFLKGKHTNKDNYIKYNGNPVLLNKNKSNETTICKKRLE